VAYLTLLTGSFYICFLFYPPEKSAEGIFYFV